jgi:hypothetical protein
MSTALVSTAMPRQLAVMTLTGRRLVQDQRAGETAAELSARVRRAEERYMSDAEKAQLSKLTHGLREPGSGIRLVMIDGSLAKPEDVIETGGPIGFIQEVVMKQWDDDLTDQESYVMEELAMSANMHPNACGCIDWQIGSSLTRYHVQVVRGQLPDSVVGVSFVHSNSVVLSDLPPEPTRVPQSQLGDCSAEIRASASPECLPGRATVDGGTRVRLCGFRSARLAPLNGAAATLVTQSPDGNRWLVEVDDECEVRMLLQVEHFTTLREDAVAAPATSTTRWRILADFLESVDYGPEYLAVRRGDAVERISEPDESWVRVRLCQGDQGEGWVPEAFLARAWQ